MADTLGKSALPKKKKTFAFLKSVSKPKPALDFDDDQDKDKDKEKDDDDALSLFKRSKDFFPIVVEEQDEAFREPTPPPKARERKYDSDDGDDRTPPSTRSSKRRKFSPTPEKDQPWRESTEDLYGAPTPPRRVSKSPSPSRSESDTEKGKETPPYQGPYKATRSRRSQTKDSISLVTSDLLPTPRKSNSKHTPARDVISLDDDDVFGAGDQASSPSPRKARASTGAASRKESTPAAIVLDSDEEDEPAEAAPEPEEEDEYAHLIRRAAQREADAKAAAAALAGAEGNGNKRVPVVSVKIFIHSRLDEAPALPPFGVKRGIAQDLGYVRQHFVLWARAKGAPISDELAERIFLTWKGRRIYNTSTGISLGWPTGEISVPPRTPGFDRSGILLEAWTNESFARYTAEMERQKLIDRGELIEEDEQKEPEKEEHEVPRIRVVLKEKDAEPLRTMAWLDSQVKILIGAYRKQRNIPADRDIRLRNEGEWLDPSWTLEQAEVEDSCTIEVYLK